MKPGQHNILGEKAGAHYVFGLQVMDDDATLVDLSGYTAALKVRYTADSPNVLLEATTENGKVALGGEPYNLLVECDLALAPGRYVYDLAIFDPEDKKWPLLTGRFEVEASTV